MQKTNPQNGQTASGVPVQLFFWPGLDATAQRLAVQLKAPAPQAFNPAEVALALRGQKKVVVLWRGPDAQMASCLIDGQPVAPALDIWKDMAQRLLALFRKNRRILILAEAKALSRVGTDALTELLGVKALPPLPAIETTSPLGQALTHLALGHDEDLRLLLAEMVASSLPVPELILGEVLEQAATQSGQMYQSLSRLEKELDQAHQLRHKSEGDRLAATNRLAEHAAEAEMLREQLGLVQSALNTQTTAAMVAAEAADMRMAALETELSLQEAKAAKLVAEGSALSAELAERAVEMQRERAEAVEQRTRSAEELALRTSEVDLMSQQVQFLQNSLSHLTGPLTRDQPTGVTRLMVAGTAEFPSPRTDDWDRALAKALAASRSEAELRAKLEKDLEAVKAKLQIRLQRDADQSFNQKLFAQMTIEATASLDEIARMAAASGVD